jgi:hypothetical protein
LVIAVADWSADHSSRNDRNFYKVEKWSKDDKCVERLLWAGNSLDKAREIFNAEVKSRTAHPAHDPPAHAGVG